MPCQGLTAWNGEVGGCGVIVDWLIGMWQLVGGGGVGSWRVVVDWLTGMRSWKLEG